jgi:NAD(P)H dehydrogenase (quinone)
MTKRILVLEGHPGGDSLCGALARAYADAAVAAGNELRVLRLSEMAFDIDMESGYGSKKPLEPCLAEVQEALTWCEHLVIAHPLWWGGVPAKLKGLLDRVLLPRFAYSYEKGNLLPVPHLTGRTAEVLVTADTPRWYLHLIIGAPGYKVMKKQILGFCGFRKIRFRTFAPVQGSSEQDRRGFLARAAGYGRAA